MFRSGDLCATFLLILILLSIGRMMVQTRPDLSLWGWRVAAVVYIAYVVLEGVEAEASDANDWLSIAFRGLFAAGLVLALAWIALPVLAFVRLHTVQRPTDRVKQWRNEVRYRRQAEEARQEQQRQEAIRKAEWERAAPEREQARVRAEAAARAKAEAQRRREDARAAALLTFSYYAVKLGRRFSRRTFDEYVQTYMGDAQPPEVVERYGRELLAIFERHLADVQPSKREMTVDSLSAWYQEQKARIETAPLDDRTRRTNLVQLYERFTELTSQLMERMQP